MYWTRDFLQCITIASCLRITAIVYQKFCTHGKTSSRVTQRIITMINQPTQLFLQYKLVHMYFHSFQFGLFTNQLQPITDAEKMSSKLRSIINVSITFANYWTMNIWTDMTDRQNSHI